MRSAPWLNIDLEKLGQNATKMAALCRAHGVEPTFVTKGFCARPNVIRVVRDCGIAHFADSRLRNIRAAKAVMPDLDFLLIRVPMLSEADAVVAWADCSLQSQIEVIRAVSAAALRQGKVHKMILMLDVGDLREGVFGEEQLLEIAPQIQACAGVELVGVGTNVGCYGSILPSVENTEILVRYRDLLNDRFGFQIQTISGGATCTTLMLEEGRLPAGINALRIGEAILFGEDTNNNRYLTGFNTDAFILGAEVVELKRKPSVPIGMRGRDGFGNVAEYPDRGVRLRAICAVGKQDVAVGALTPLLPGAVLIGASSDHLIIDVEDCGGAVAVGTVLTFRCGYAAALVATTSAYVNVVDTRRS